MRHATDAGVGMRLRFEIIIEELLTTFEVILEKLKANQVIYP
jgi:hypothetical protein